MSPHTPEGYEPHSTHGAKIRADVVDVYVFRRRPAPSPMAYEEAARSSPVVEFLQLLRSGEPLGGTWHPVMGHVGPGETSAACALRELDEELGLRRTDAALLGLWALEQVHPFYISAIDTVVLSPRFAAEVSLSWTPKLNQEHSAHRWIAESAIDASFMWPGQRACCREILGEIVRDASLSRDRLRVPIRTGGR